MTARGILEYINSKDFENVMTEELSVSQSALEAERERFVKAVREFMRLYGEGREMHLFSVGGRSEISGNHTDHNNGRVLAASVNLSIIAVVSQRDDGVIRLKSEGFDEDVVAPEKAKAPNSADFGKSAALIAGCSAALLKNGYKTGGFDAYTVSNVLKGSGLSSSAAFEAMVCKILSALYNEDSIPAAEIAKMSRYAENIYFGKPCGLMDQAACAVGGFIAVDFEKDGEPKIEALDFDLGRAGYSLCITDTGGNHADLTPHYASIPSEMKAVANFFGKRVLRESDKDTVLKNSQAIRRELGDRAWLRALHFFDENERVAKQTDALRNGDIDAFLSLAEKSGLSSFRYLQNVFASIPEEEGIACALYISEDFFETHGIKGACRVHGGGFAGTQQAFVPNEYALLYKEHMERYFGKDSCHILKVRKAGALCLV